MQEVSFSYRSLPAFNRIQKCRKCLFSRVRSFCKVNKQIPACRRKLFIYFHIQTSSIRRKDPTLIVRIFLFQRALIQYRDIFIFKHFAFTSEMLRFLWDGTYHVIVRGGSHFCQSPKSGGVKSFLIKTQGRAKTFFWTEIPKFPSPPLPKNKRTVPYG